MSVLRAAMRSRGAFIVLEGCDRCGKSTQAKLLVKRLTEAGVAARLVRFPDRSTATGGLIDGYLKQSTDLSDQVIHLLFSANRWEAASTLTDVLNGGTTLVVDRYAYSGVAFSVAKGLDLDWCRQPDAGLPAADAVFYLDLPAGAAAARDGFGGERYERPQFQKNVHGVYERLRDPSWAVRRLARRANAFVVQTIDATPPVDVIADDLLARSLRVVAAARDSALRHLWTN